MEAAIKTEKALLQELQKLNWIHTLGDGLIMFGDRFLSLAKLFDRTILNIALQKGAKEWHVPALLPRTMLMQIEYPKHFGSTLFRAVQDESRYSVDADDALALLPSACFHSYLRLAHSVRDECAYITTNSARVFRHETNLHDFGRLMEFNVREIVFFGCQKDVRQIGEAMVNDIVAALEVLGLRLTLETALDPFFFFIGDRKKKDLYDIPDKTKQELLLKSQDRPLAIGSLNYHGKFFGAQFGICGRHEEIVESGCIGVGLERCVFAFLLENGTDTDGWPPIARKGVE